MSNTYKHGDRVPSEVLCRRLNELADAVTKGRESVAREFTMRFPAERDRDADPVLSQAAKRISELEAALTQQQEAEPVVIYKGKRHNSATEMWGLLTTPNAEIPNGAKLYIRPPAAQALTEQEQNDMGTGAKWRQDSSLETWFPYTAQRLAELEAKAAQPQVPEGYALTPIEPADGLLISMACRDRHDFGLLSRGMQESIMGSMRQVHQEVVGAGSYNPDKEAEYKSMLSAAKEEGR